MKIFFIKKKILSTFLFSLFLTLFFCFLFLHQNYYLPTSSIDVSNVLPDALEEVLHSNQKVAYLTFDDGPSTSVTPKILDILAEEKIKATFFVIGKSVEDHPEIVKQAYEDGHFIANHSYSHNNALLYKDSKSFMSEIQKTDLAIGKAIGEEEYCSHLFRFPNGYMSSIYKKQKEKAVALLHEMGYSFIDWNCLTKDAEKKCSNYQLLCNLKETSKNKSTLVVLMHDTKDVNDSSLVLKDVISYLKKQGYLFKNFYSLIE